MCIYISTNKRSRC